jgi:CheY-like chemotaxis protein
MLQKPLAADAAQASDCQAQRMAIVGHLTGVVVHHFNNLLTVITGTIEVFEEMTGEGSADTGLGISAANVPGADHVTIAVSVSGHGISTDRQLTFADLGMATDFATRADGNFDGNIKVCRVAGRETSVEIHLPRAADFIRPPAQPSGTADMEGGDQAILIVEDDILVRRYVVGQVLSLGYRTLAAGNAGEAMAIIDASEEVDLLLTDVMMPGLIDDRQLAVEALNRRPSLKILYTSGYSENAMIHDGHLDAGALLLAKPYRKADLAGIIRAALAG